jgi:uncharacterized RDD family membrane protein YckC
MLQESRTLNFLYVSKNVTVENLAPPATADQLPPAAEIIPPRFLSPAWRRAIAFFDILILGVPATIISIPLNDVLARMGYWAGFIGPAAALVYFSILDSEIANGQTLGKRWLKVQVVDLNGKTISFRRSVLRSSIFVIPFCAGTNLQVFVRGPLAFLALIAFAVSVVDFANCYLVLFNRDTPQGLHDLAAGSNVTGTERRGAGARSSHLENALGNFCDVAELPRHR